MKYIEHWVGGVAGGLEEESGPSRPSVRPSCLFVRPVRPARLCWQSILPVRIICMDGTHRKRGRSMKTIL